MKRTAFSTFLLTCFVTASAEVIQFELSPAGTDNAVGLSPANEVPPVGTPSNGSGDELFNGITFDTDTSILAFVFGYGSAVAFTDLTGPVTALHIHGPAPAGEPAGVVFPLTEFLFPNQDPARGGIVLGAIQYNEAQAADLMAGLHYINLHTAANTPGEIRGQLIPILNNAPSIECPEPVTVECETHEGTEVTLSVTVADADGDPLTVVWKVNGEEVQTDEVQAGDPSTEATLSLTHVFALGVNEVTVSVSDGSEDSAECATSVTVVDTEPPAILNIEPSPKVLWPPNHKMVDVRILIEASDACGEVTSRIVEVESNEPVNGRGDGNTSPDWMITGDLKLKLRAERSGRGNGRVYTVTVETTDDSGNVTTSKVQVRVPHDQRGEVRKS